VLTAADYNAVPYTAPANTCPAGASCSQVTYYQPNQQILSQSILLNLPNFNRNYNGAEITGRKRMSNHWLMNTSFAYNSTIQNYGAGDFQDPTNIAQHNGFQYDYLSSGSGLGNVFVNSKWLFKLSGLYELPYQFNVSAFYNSRQGYPFERTITSPSRANGAGTSSVLLEGVGTVRLPTYQNLDFHVERPIRFATIRMIPAIDLFNVLNVNTLQAERGAQNSSNANAIQAITAPRVLRFGVRVTF
jgi:hypothetical protein